MPPRSPTSSSLLFSLFALGSLTGSSVTASPALQERQFGTGTGTGSGSGGCAALVASGNYSQSLLLLTSIWMSPILWFIRRTNSGQIHPDLHLDALFLQYHLYIHMSCLSVVFIAYTPSAVRACLESTPFSESVRTNTLDYIRGMLTLDV
jgi:hypothetical protein